MATIQAIDTQFALGSGSNFNSKNGRSDFDTPLDANTDLVITAQPDDPSPRLFSLGETYDLTWQGASGAMSMADAVVVRSDHYLGGTQGVVVFEGVDQNGTPTHVVWTENLDLHQWYQDNFNGPNPPVFWNTDKDASTYGYICFAADTPILTAHGPRAAGALALGERLLTHDHGPQPIRWIGRQAAPCTGQGVPVRFAPGVLGNARPLVLSPQHRVLLSGSEVARHTGHHEVLVPAKALTGRPGVHRAPGAARAYVNLLLDRHELVLAGGALCETLFLGPYARRVIAAAARAPGAELAPLPPSHRRAWSRADDAARPMLDGGAARALARALGPAPLVDSSALAAAKGRAAA